MKIGVKLTVSLIAATLALGGCGGGSSNTETETATINGTLIMSAAIQAVSPTTATNSYYVEAVDESGQSRDTALGVTDDFSLTVPTGHDYVLVVGDENGPIGGMRYQNSGAEQSAFHISKGADDVNLGSVRVNAAAHRVTVELATGLEPGEHSYADDSDNDGIPDEFERDSDDDGTPDDSDTDNSGNAGTGAAIYSSNCAGCHGEDGRGTALVDESIRGTSAAKMAVILGNGIRDDDENMPAFASLIGSAGDLAAFLDGTPTSPTTPSVPAPPTTPTTPALDGAALYDQYCASCHVQGKRGKSASATTGAINSNRGGMGSLSFLTQEQINAISSY